MAYELYGLAQTLPALQPDFVYKASGTLPGVIRGWNLGLLNRWIYDAPKTRLTLVFTNDSIDYYADEALAIYQYLCENSVELT